MKVHDRLKRALRQPFLALVLVILGSGGLIPPAAMAAPLRILVFGDSLVAGLGLAQGDGFVPQLQHALHKAGLDVELINGGVSGDTTSTALGRLDWVLGDDPQAAIVELGANDMLQGVPVLTIEQNLDRILKAMTQRGMPVLIAGMRANRGLGPDYVKAFDGLYPRLAGKYNAILYPFFLDGVAMDPKLNQDDMMHPNKKGVAKIVKAMIPYVRKLVAAASP